MKLGVRAIQQRGFRFDPRLDLPLPGYKRAIQGVGGLFRRRAPDDVPDPDKVDRVQGFFDLVPRQPQTGMQRA